MTGLVEFLTARLDEEESGALGAAEEVGRSWRASSGDAVCGDGNHAFVIGPWGGWIGEPTAEHIARYDPARVLAEVAAKRSLIDEIESYEARIEGEWGSGRAGSGFGDWESALRFLAAPYADHPDFDESWRVAAIVRDRETT